MRSFFLDASFPSAFPSFLAASADVLAPEWGGAECGGSPGSSVLPGSEQEAVESTDVPGCWDRSYPPERHTEPGENSHNSNIITEGEDSKQPSVLNEGVCRW